MATIQMIRAGYSAQEAEQASQSTSMLKDDAEVITPEEELDAAPGDNEARRKIFDYSKSHLLNLKAQGWDTKIRAEREGFGPAREYDHLSIGFTAEETRYLKDDVDAQKRLMDAIRAVTKSETGAQKAAIITKPHFDTANAHVHVLLHRHAVDKSAQRIEQSDDLSKRSNASAFLDRLNNELEKRGLQKMTDFRLQDGSGLMMDVSKSQAKAEVAQKIEDAGGVSVMRADSSLTNVSVERESLVKLEHEARADAERAQMEMQRLQAVQQAAIERLTLAQQAQAALAERDTLTAERDGLASERDALTAERDGLVSERDTLSAENAQLAERTMQQQAEIEQQRETIEQSKSEIERISEELAGERGAREALAGELEAEKRERATLAKEVENVKAEVSKRDEQIQSQQSQLDEMRRELDQMKELAQQQRDLAQQQSVVMQQQSTQIETVKTEAVAARTEAKAWEERYRNETEKTMRVATVNTFTVLSAEAEVRGDVNGAEMFREYAERARSGDRETAKDLHDVAKQYAEQKQHENDLARESDFKRVNQVREKITREKGFREADDESKAEKGGTYLGRDKNGVEYHRSRDGRALVAVSPDGSTEAVGNEKSAETLIEQMTQEREARRDDKGPELE